MSKHAAPRPPRRPIPGSRRTQLAAAALTAGTIAAAAVLMRVYVYLYLHHSAFTVIIWTAATAIAAVLLIFAAVVVAHRRGDPFGPDHDADADEHLRPLKTPGAAEHTLTHDLGQLGFLLRPKGLSPARATALARKVARQRLRSLGRKRMEQAATVPTEVLTGQAVLMPLPAPVPETEDPPAAITDDTTLADPLYKPWEWPETEEFPVIEPTLRGGAA